jgi:hypothetical protein
MKAVATIFICLSLGLVGCASQVPVPTRYPSSTQPTLLAAQHWQGLAADMSNRLRIALGSLQTGEGPIVLYVQPSPVPSTFSVVFYDLLVTELMQAGFGISRVPSADALSVEYSVLPAGEADFDVQGINSQIYANDSDVVFNLAVLSGNRYVTRVSEVFYVLADDLDEYVALGYGPTRIMGVVGP